MNIIKKNGKVESFDLSKISTSIENSAEDISFMITDADLNLVVSQIKDIISSLSRNTENTSTYEIRGIIYSVLLENKFTELCRSYMNL